MTLVWIVIGSVALIAASLWYGWREKAQAEAVKQYILETAELERRLALMNPRLARGVPLEPDEQAWLEKMLFERRITSDPTKWARPDLGYDSISGTLGEFFAVFIESGGSAELLEMKAEHVRQQKIQRMIADIGMPETEDQIKQWWDAHSMGESNVASAPSDSPAAIPQTGHRFYHAAVVRKPPFLALYEAA